LEKPTRLSLRVCVGVLARDGNVSPPMAMFLASQPYFFNEFDCKIFDGRLGGGWNEVYAWMSRQQADYYVFMDGTMCPDPNIPSMLISRGVDVAIPPVWEIFNGTRLLNASIDGKTMDTHKDCGFQECVNSTLSIVCLSNRALASLLMAGELINDENLMAPIKALGYPIYIDWTVSPTLKWADEFREHGNQMLQAYGVWYTRIKRGMPL